MGSLSKKLQDTYWLTLNNEVNKVMPNGYPAKIVIYVMSKVLYRSMNCWRSMTGHWSLILNLSMIPGTKDAAHSLRFASLVRLVTLGFLSLERTT